MNVRLCIDAFKSYFREGVYTHILVGVVRANFCHCCVIVQWCVKFGLCVRLSFLS